MAHMGDPVTILGDLRINLAYRMGFLWIPHLGAKKYSIK